MPQQVMGSRCHHGLYGGSSREPDSEHRAECLARALLKLYCLLPVNREWPQHRLLHVPDTASFLFSYQVMQLCFCIRKWSYLRYRNDWRFWKPVLGSCGKAGCFRGRFLSHFSNKAQEITVKFTSALNPVEIKFDTVVKMKKENC